MSIYHGIFIMTIFTTLSWQSKIEYKQIRIHNKDISIEIPTNWRINNKYPRYSDYRLKYGVQYKGASDLSEFTVNVYDNQRSDSNKITMKLVEFYKENKRKFYGETIMFIDSGIKNLNNNKVGFVKYKFSVKDGGVRYGVIFFFLDQEKEFYEIEINNYKINNNKFKEVADRVFNSLKML